MFSPLDPMNAAPDEKSLFKSMQNGDEKALETIFKRYYSRLCAFSLTIVHQQTVAEEVVADLFMGIWVKRDKIELKTSLKAYLFTAVKNLSINAIDKKKLLISFEHLPEYNHQFSDSALDLILQNEKIGHLNSIINAMPPQRQMVFRLHRIEGFSYAEIAETLGISIYTVQNHMAEAIKHMSHKHATIMNIVAMAASMCMITIC
jgi:RNA polymerase sigma-70 factor, ECF subfamily